MSKPKILNQPTQFVALRFILFLSIFMNLIGCAPSEKIVYVKQFVPETPIVSPDASIETKRKNADILRSQDKDFMASINDPALTAVTQEFGYSVIKAKVFPFNSGSAKADIKPWSSWWFPKRDAKLFDDSKARNSTDYENLSALTKYDIYRKSRNPEAGSSAKYEQNSYNPNSLTWEGLCDAWSMASITFPEPKRSVTIPLGRSGITANNMITFYIDDLKALLLKTFEAVDDKTIKYYGQKFTGQENGWIYPDIFPEQFHRFLEVQLFEKHKPFIIDHDQGIEVWNVPIFKANYTMTAIPDKPDSVFVRTWVYYADSIKTKEKNFIGTKEVVREYDYVLEGERNSDGDLVVKIGYWVKGPTGNDSRRDHPDFIMLPPPPEQLVRKSWNPEIDVSTVDEILSLSYNSN